MARRDTVGVPAGARSEPSTDGTGATERLVRALQYFSPGLRAPTCTWSTERGRQAEEFCTPRWRHDRSCGRPAGGELHRSGSWNVYVKTA